MSGCKAKDIVIIGCGGFGKEVAWIIERINEKSKEWNILGFADDCPDYAGKTVYNYKVLGSTDVLRDMGEIYVICAVADCEAKKEIVNRISSFENIRFATVIDPTCICHESAKIGEGSILCTNTMVNMDAHVGKHVTMVDRAAIGHDTIIGDFSVLFVGATVAGSTVINECCQIGMGAQILQNMNIGKNTVVGAGAVVCRDLPSDCIALGIPAKPVK